MYKYMKEVDILISSMIDKLITEKRLTENSIYIYRRYVEKFFENEMNKNDKMDVPLLEISARDVKSFLANIDVSETQKLNYYNILNYFFTYTYHINETKEIMSAVIKPVIDTKDINVIEGKNYTILRTTLLDFSSSVDIKKRLLVAFGLFAGLTRDTISKITFDSIIFSEGCYKLLLKADDSIEQIYSLNNEMQLILHEFSILHNKETEKYKKIFDNNSNYLSTLTSTILKEILGNESKYTLNDLNDTFIIKEIVKGNDVVTISKLTKKNIATLNKHIAYCEKNYNLYE